MGKIKKFHCALITGASSGIGEALAYLLFSKGIHVILSGRNLTRLKKIAHDVKADTIIAADLNDRQQRQKLVSIIKERTPDLLINNAGFGIYGDALSISVADQLAILEVNAAAVLELTLEAARALAYSNKKGVVMNVSSVAGEHPCPGMSVYGGAKAFITKVSQALNTELASKGIAILASCPGMVATDFANRAAKKRVMVHGKPLLSAQYAAQQIWKQIQTRQEKRIFNWHFRLGSFLATLVPSSVVKKIIWKQIKERM